MAVKKIRKISSTVLIVLALIGVVAFGMTVFGGYVDPNAEYPEPVFTNVLLYTVYGMVTTAFLAMIIFGIVGFAQSFKTNRKAALSGLGALLGLIVLMVIAYFVGSDAPLRVGVDAQQFNTPSWLKLADMCMFTIYALIVINVLALVVTSFMSAGPKQHASASERKA